MKNGRIDRNDRGKYLWNDYLFAMRQKRMFLQYYIAVERGCGRMEWWGLDWNQPSIDFYLSLGAEPMKDWTTYRIAGDTLKKMAEE